MSGRLPACGNRNRAHTRSIREEQQADARETPQDATRRPAETTDGEEGNGQVEDQAVTETRHGELPGRSELRQGDDEVYVPAMENHATRVRQGTAGEEEGGVYGRGTEKNDGGED